MALDGNTDKRHKNMSKLMVIYVKFGTLAPVPMVYQPEFLCFSPYY
jgi:hypothetical protein